MKFKKGQKVKVADFDTLMEEHRKRFLIEPSSITILHYTQIANSILEINKYYIASKNVALYSFINKFGCAPENCLTPLTKLDEIELKLNDIESEIEKLKNETEIYDLPDDMCFSKPNFKSESIGIHFNDNRQILIVKKVQKIYNVIGNVLLRLNKANYCLVKSNAEECFITGQVFYTSLEGQPSNDIYCWSIALDEHELVGTDKDETGIKVIKRKNLKSGLNYFRLVKRNEV